MSDAQTIFCERHGLPYDPEWTRGMANIAIDRALLEVRVQMHGCQLGVGYTPNPKAQNLLPVIAHGACLPACLPAHLLAGDASIPATPA
jgi:hypothetical protein